MCQLVKISFVFATIWQTCFSLYEDQIGKFDWRQQHLGRPVFIRFDSSGFGGNKIIVATEQNVLASINPRNGEINWRLVFEEKDQGRIDDILLYDEYVVVILAGGSLVRCFTSAAGYLKWEDSIHGVNTTTRGKLIQFKEREVLALSRGELRHYSINTGHIHWTMKLPKSDVTTYFTAVTNQDSGLVLGLVPRASIGLVSVPADGSTALAITANVLTPWLSESTACTPVANTHLLCADKDSLALNLVFLNDTKEPKVYPLAALGISATPSTLDLLDQVDHNVLVRLSPLHVVMVTIVDDELRLAYNMENVQSAQLMSYEEQQLLMSVMPAVNGVADFRAIDLETGKAVPDFSTSITLTSHHGLVQKVYCFVSKKRDGTRSFRIALLSEDHSILMIQSTGKLAWLREESLASIVSVQMVDLPVSPILAKMEDEFGAANGDIFSMFKNRIQTQLLQLKEFILSLPNKLRRHQLGYTEEDILNPDDVDYVTRDEFNLHKVIVIATESGKLYGLDSSSGNPFWKRFLNDTEPFQGLGDRHTMLLFTQRTTAHFPHKPRCILIAKNKVSGQPVLFTFDPVSGDPIENPLTLPYTIKQVMLLSHMTSEFIHPLLILDSNLQYHVYPDTALPLVERLADRLFLFNADVQTGVITGYTVDIGTQSLSASEHWAVTTARSAGAVITAVACKAPGDLVHSLGVVLGDRNVLYKYINPNLVVVATENNRDLANGVVMVYLIDSVTGHIVASFIHKRCRGPIHLVHSEHWVVYDYWNQKSRRTEIVTIELYEGNQQRNNTAFSSLEASRFEPIIVREAFFFNGHITAMQTTMTERGLTNKMVIMALSFGGILGMPKVFLDARRPITPSELTREEGLLPYAPELPRPYELMINYNSSVENIRNIVSAPSGLESTSLVFCYGLDIFYTHVFPSKLFDVLKDDFDYFLISIVLTSMIAVSVVARNIAAGKLLRRAWK